MLDRVDQPGDEITDNRPIVARLGRPTVAAMLKSASRVSLLSAVTVACVALNVRAAVDTVVTVAPNAIAVGGVTPASAISTFGYSPADTATGRPERLYVAGFNGLGQDLRVIDNISSTPAPTTFTRLITNTPWTLFTKDGDLDRGGGAPTPGSITFNKVAIGNVPAYSFAIISEGGGRVTIGGVEQPNLTQRLYRYNLAQDTNGDARDEFTSLVKLSDMQQAISRFDNNLANVSRQVALSSDSATTYFIDTSAVFGGLWSVPSLGGAPVRLFADAAVSAEPAVIRRDGSDRVVFNGTAGSGNAGGLDQYNTATGTRSSLLDAQTLATFLETTVADISIASTTSDEEGNVYFNQTDSSPERRGIYKLDTQNRLIKLASIAERTAVTGGTNSNTLRMQTRTTTFTGPEGAFPITQVMYSEAGVSQVSGVNVFKAGDFDRDNTVAADDFDLFEAALTLKGVPVANVEARKFDANGNGTVDFNDVKIFQSFVGFLNGDADFSFDVGFDDLLRLAGAYGQSNTKWTSGDFDGNQATNFDDLLILAQNYGGTTVNPAAFSADFAADWSLAQSLVPEPTSVVGLFGLALAALPRRRATVG